MNIAQLSAHLDSRSGGVSEVVLNLGRVLAERGHDVSLHGRLELAQAEAISRRAPGVQQESGLLSIASHAANGDREILHSHGIWDPLLSAALFRARGKGIPTVISPHGMLDSWAMRQGRPKKKLALATFERLNLIRAGCIHALTPKERDCVKEYFPQVPVAVIPNGVAMPECKPPTDAAKGTGNTLLFLGRLHPKKGIVELVDAFAALVDSPEAREWEITIAGWDDGGHQTQIEDTIARHGLSDRVKVVGPVFGADKDRLIADASAFALTSYSEGLPMAVLEAWSHVKPALITPECNLPQGENAGAAIVCDVGTQGAKDGLERLMRLTPEKREAMGEAGRKLVAEQFSWPKVAENFESLYSWIRGHGERPPFVTD